MSKMNIRSAGRLRRKQHIKKKLHGTAERPRLCVFRSAQHIYAQVIDDDLGATLASASTLSEELGGLEGHRGNKTAAKAVGELIGQKAKAAGIAKVAFDRNGYLFHGCVKALADGARSTGLSF
jgi:large subunit ribosomal protein L18